MKASSTAANNDINHGIMQAVQGVQGSQGIIDSESMSMEGFNMGLTLEVWDKMRDLSSELATSVMTVQASVLCQRVKSGENLDYVEASNEPGSVKRRKTVNRGRSSNETHPAAPYVSEEDGDSNSSLTTVDSDPCGAESLSEDVERMARMTKLLLDMEECQRKFREEMVAIGNRNDVLL